MIKVNYLFCCHNSFKRGPLTLAGATLGAGIIGGVGSALGGALGLGAQSSANKTNLKLAQMNNDFNERMLNKQMQYNTDMWNKQNEYNLPSAQMQRFRDAGLNPYLMMNGSSANLGSASSVNSAGLASSSGNPSVSPLNYGDAFGGAINSFMSTMSAMADLDNKRAQTEGLRIENKYKVMNAVADIANKWANTKNLALRNDYQGILNSFAPQLNQLEVDNRSASVQLVKSQNALAISQAALNEQLTNKEIINNKYLDRRNLEELNLMVSQRLLNRSSAKLNYANVSLVAANTVESYLRAHGIKVDNDTKEAIQGSIVSSYYNNASITEEKARNMYEYGAEQAPSLTDWNVGGEFSADSHGDVDVPGLGKFGAGTGVKINGKYSGRSYNKRKH